MLIKFFNSGKGDPHKAVRYLLAPCDHSGRPRDEVVVLRGDPKTFADLAASLPFVERFTSGVIAWAPGDQPTAAEIQEVCERFEDLAFAGLGGERVCHTIVSHGDHVHFLVARVDLETGKSFNIAPPSWRKDFDHLRDHFNHLRGWARPDDPDRRRAVQYDSGLRRRCASIYRQAEANASELGFELADVCLSMGVEPDPKLAIGERVIAQVMNGGVKNRQDVLSLLSQYGQVTRVGDDYLSIKHFDSGMKMRFKGLAFEKDFDATKLLERERVPLSYAGGLPNQDAAKMARAATDRATLRRAAFYQGPTRKPRRPKKQATTVLPSPKPTMHPVPLLPPKEDADERNHDLAIEGIEEAFRATRSAIARFVITCRAALKRYRAVGKQLLESQRALLSAERTCLDIERESLNAERPVAERQQEKRLTNAVTIPTANPAGKF